MNNMTAFVRRISLLLLAAILLLLPMGAAYAERPDPDELFTFGEQSACDYYLKGTLPIYRRSLPISDDDPNADTVDDTALIRYQYGYAFPDVNDYYIYNRVSGEWEGTQPIMDTGVLIGGNTRSKHDATQLDFDSIDFCNVLPYASIYIDSKKLSYTEGTIEYEFFTDDFNYNNSLGEVPENITLKGNQTLTTYQEKFPDLTYPRKHEIEHPVAWEGVIYSGGMKKTVSDGKGGYTETVVRNDDNGGVLFTARYKDAAVDTQGNSYDLVLSFTQLTFVAEADVNGPLGILEANNLYVAPVLYEDGHYTIVIDDDSNRVDVHDLDGVRIGARFEFDYSVVDADGNPAEGLILYSMNDMDNASMATMLQTNADWGRNPLGNDFKWAEGFGIVKGAASFAVLPYFNHEILDVYGRRINNLNGDTSLLRISRMPGTVPDGTANGLYFTTSITAVSGTGARNDSDTLDTGIAMLLYPQGSMVAAISSGRRGDVNITFFDNSVSNRITQSASEGGWICSLDHSLREGGAIVENTDLIKVVGGGSSSTHRIEADAKHRVFSLHIDGREIPYRALQWEEQPDGSTHAVYTVSDEYGRYGGKTEYTFVKDPSEVITVRFENIQDDHEIHVDFVRKGLFGMFRIIGTRSLIALFLLGGFFLLIFLSSIYWMTKGRKENQMPNF